ncbi:MAG TPA: uracil-DNA glycosylase family protein [Candidatus Paceibacterota bacterium]|nr:uracil-DNA glycosylase family protein [Candidatus Paceibacterota bacterium]
MDIQIERLKKNIDKLQKTHGHPDYTALYGTGCIDHPDLFLILMNPTARNISVHKDWKGLKASWLGTKNFWKILYKLELISAKTFAATQERAPAEWDNDFCVAVYTELARNKVFITNLGRSTQPDARPLPDAVYKACVALTQEEINAVKPKVVVLFGNQVSSALLETPIKVSETRKKRFDLEIGGTVYPVYATYYPVGMGFMNADKTIEDVRWIRKAHSR